MKTQRGAAMVEFALIALLFFMLLFGIIEFARAMFVYNTLVEATRRGARVAAVCPVSPEGINQVKFITTFNLANGTGASLLGLSAASNIAVKYYKKNMTTPITVTSTYPSVKNSDYDEIRFVSVEITNYTHKLFIPLFSSTLTAPNVSTTLPSESLGRISPKNPVKKRCCYNICATT
jgi:Flp pilus assembly protein TadG